MVIESAGFPPPAKSPRSRCSPRPLPMPSAAPRTRSGGMKSMEAYKADKIYTTPVVTIIPEERFVSIGGDVRVPQRVIYTPDMTPTERYQHRAAAFTEYANKRSCPHHPRTAGHRRSIMPRRVSRCPEVPILPSASGRPDLSCPALDVLRSTGTASRHLNRRLVGSSMLSKLHVLSSMAAPGWLHGLAGPDRFWLAGADLVQPAVAQASEEARVRLTFLGPRGKAPCSTAASTRRWPTSPGTSTTIFRSTQSPAGKLSVPPVPTASALADFAGASTLLLAVAPSIKSKCPPTSAPP